MNLKAIGRGIQMGLKVAVELVTMGVIKGKGKTAIETADKIDKAIEKAKAQPATPPTY